MKKILVTGTAGFIGFHLINKLKEFQYDIVGLDNINNYYDINLKYARLQQQGVAKAQIAYGKIVRSSVIPFYRFIQLDLCDKEKISNLFKEEQFDAVIHLAAQAGVRYSMTNPHAYTESNVTGFLNILEGCRSVNVKHLVFASTSSVYGLNTDMPLSAHKNADHPISLYAATKKANEMMAHSYSYLFDLSVTGVRFFSAYGPWGRPDMALFMFTKAILNKEPIKVFNKGEMIRDFTYVDDIADALCRILEKPARPDPQWYSNNPDPAASSAAYKLLNVGNSNPVKLMDYIEAIENTLGLKAIKELLPMQPGDVPATNADIRDVMVNYGYKPQTQIKKGIENFINWYLNYYRIQTPRH